MNQYNQTDHYILGIPTLNPEAAERVVSNQVPSTLSSAHKKGRGAFSLLLL